MTTQSPEKELQPKQEDKIIVGGIPFSHSMEPKDFTELKELAQLLAASDIVPKDAQRKPANVLLMLMFGRELGITSAQAIQNVMVVNGRPSMWGDALMGKVLASSVYEEVWDEFDEKTMTATVHAKRKGQKEVVRTFSKADAEKAGLWTKPGPWQQYPKRMLYCRARAFALRDAFADVLKGIRIAEEELDTVELVRQKDGTYAPKDLGTAPMPQRASDKKPFPITLPETTTAPAAETPKAEPVLLLEKITSKADKDGVILYFYCSNGKRYEMTTGIKEADKIEKDAKGWIVNKIPLLLELQGDQIETLRV